MDLGLVARALHGGCGQGEANGTGPERATAPVQLGSVGRIPTAWPK
jgi:hypothetical protein